MFDKTSLQFVQLENGEMFMDEETSLSFLSARGEETMAVFDFWVNCSFKVDMTVRQVKKLEHVTDRRKRCLNPPFNSMKIKVK